jgi:hypothetical protein
MPYHTGGMKKANGGMKKTKAKKAMSSRDKYSEHKKHHSPKHIKAMKALERKGLSFNSAHSFVQKYIGK